MPAFANDPLSAIEWLEKRPKQIVEPLALPEKIDEPPVAGAVTTPEITVTPLGAPTRASAGLLPSSVTGLPRSIWQGSDVEDLTDLIEALDLDEMPALQSLLYTLLLAEADPPQNETKSAFMRARVKKLLALGALEPASALLDRADPAHPDLFDLYFDVALLNGDADAPCRDLRAVPALSRDLAHRIFCDARAQNWDSAALSLSTADAIGALEKIDVTLLERFLDPELFENTPLPAPPKRPSALQFRLFEAIGEALPTASLPRQFSATDLSGDAGWKAQLDAAERLTRVGAISEQRLLGIYTRQIPSASGGIWDRVEAIQRFDTAIKSGDHVAISKQLTRVWPLMERAQLQVPFATMFAQDLLRLPDSFEQFDLVTKIVLLSPLYEQAAQRETADTAIKTALSVAVGEAKNYDPSALSAALETIFSGAAAPQHLIDLGQNGQLGEAIIRAMALTESGARGDISALQNGLSYLRSVGLEDTVRRAALQNLLLSRAN